MKKKFAGEIVETYTQMLDADNHALAAPTLISLGGPSTAAVDPGVVFAAAMKLDAKARRPAAAAGNDCGSVRLSECLSD